MQRLIVLVPKEEQGEHSDQDGDDNDDGKESDDDNENGRHSIDDRQEDSGSTKEDQKSDETNLAGDQGNVDLGLNGVNKSNGVHMRKQNGQASVDDAENRNNRLLIQSIVADLAEAGNERCVDVGNWYQYLFLRWWTVSASVNPFSFTHINVADSLSEAKTQCPNSPQKLVHGHRSLYSAIQKRISN